MDGESGPGWKGGTTPTNVTGIGPAREVKTGSTASCALLVDKSVWCWGSNASATLGVPDASATADGGLAPVQVLPVGAAAGLLMGDSHACVLTAATPATVQCWGNNSYGQAGVADAATVATPTTLSITDVDEIGASDNDTCFTRSVAPEGECIGDNREGELGRGGSDDGGIDGLPHPVPATVALGTLGALRGFYHSSGPQTGALFASGQIALWGSNADGQLGSQNDSGAPDPAPALVPFDDITALTMTAAATCVVRSDGTVWCWGTTTYGQTGSSAPAGLIQVAPVQVTGIAGATALTGGFYHLCAIVTAGAVECWGFNNYGQLGRTTTAEYDPAPQPVVF